MRIFQITVFALVLSSPSGIPTADAAGHWTPKDVARQLAFEGLLVLDWGQTLDISARPGEYREYNPVLGDHPSRGDVNRYFLTCALVQFAIAHYLGHGALRSAWQYSGIGLEAGVVANNRSIGLSVRF